MFQQLSLVQMTIFMALGAVFALVGLYFLFRPPRTDGETKLQMFGITVNASSVGLVVFLVGAAFVAMRDSTMVPLSNEIPRETGDDQEGTAPETPASGAVPQRKVADGDESEPNDTWDDAHVIEAGGSVSGAVSNASDDWFYVATDPSQPELIVEIRSNSWNCLGQAQFFFPDETKAMRGRTSDFLGQHTITTWKGPIKGHPGMFIHLSTHDESCSYDLFTSYG